MRILGGLWFCVGVLLAGHLALHAQTPADSATKTNAAADNAPATAVAPARLKPETEEALLLGEKALNEKKYDDAIKQFKRGIKIESDKCSRCYVRMAEAQAALGDK